MRAAMRCPKKSGLLNFLFVHQNREYVLTFFFRSSDRFSRENVLSRYLLLVKKHNFSIVRTIFLATAFSTSIKRFLEITIVT